MLNDIFISLNNMMVNWGILLIIKNLSKNFNGLTNKFLIL
jgi:hypothetical protein